MRAPPPVAEPPALRRPAPRLQRRWAGYVAALLLVAAAGLLRWALPSALAPAPYLGFYPAVVVAGALGGAGPGLVATFASLLLVNFVFGHFDVHDHGAMGRQLVWVVASVGVSLLAGRQRAARLRERQHAEELRRWKDELELRVEQRTLEIQAANRDLRAANDKLAELDHAKTAFFSNVSHEFRTPLTLLLGPLEAELAQRAAAAPEELEGLRVAERNALRLLKLVNTLLDFSRLEAGRMQGSYHATDLGRLTEELAGSFRPLCDKAGLALRVDSPPLAELAWVDRDMWEKIVLNLISNAFKFTPAGEIEVSLRLARGAFELRVRDSGVGIPEDELPRIFERFHRVESTRGRSLEGTGIGLSLVRDLVGLHGGAASVESTLGQGTTFTVTVPAGSAHLPQDRVGAAPEQPAAVFGANRYVEEARRWLPTEDPGPAATDDEEPAPAGPRFRVLLADDNADMRAYICRILARRFDVETVVDGQAALEVARQRRPDLVLSDVMMPRLDGFGLLRALRADPALGTLPVILVSARAGEEAAGEGVQAGADDYLIKPFSARELLARVTTHIKLARAREEVEHAHGREEALQEAAARKDEFMAMLSHELRNPLAPIQNSLYVLARVAPESDQAKRANAVIGRQTAHLTRLVEGLLDMTRIAHGKIELQRRPLDLAALSLRAVEDHRSLFDRGGISLALRAPAAAVLVNGDPTRLVQVVGNLLQNAAKFTPRGGAVTVTVEVDPSLGQALLAVRDTGCGLRPEALPGLFQAFAQVDAALDRARGGLGLGLAVVKGLVELHGGTVGAASAGLGSGATFTIRLPLAEPVSRAEPGRREETAAARGCRVLIIEDNEDAADSLREMLEIGAHTVEVAHRGPEGIVKARAFAPDLVLCDIGLPDMDGYAVARAMRADAALAHVFLAALTGYAQPEDVARAQAAGFDLHLAKPPSSEALERALGGACRAP